MKFYEFQELIKEEFGIDHLADIARVLNVTPQAVSNWKSRNRVPYKYVIETKKILKTENQKINQDKKILNKEASQLFVSNDHTNIVDNDTISIIDIFLTMAKHIRIIIIIPFILCAIMIFNVQFRMPYVYQSKTRIMSTGSSGSNISQTSSIASQFGIKIPSNNPEPKWVYPEIIKSRTLARSMLKRKFDTKRYGKQKSLLQILTYGNNDPMFGSDTLIKYGIEGLIGMIHVGEEGPYYDLTVTTFEPVFAKDILVALLDELDSHQREYNKTKTREARQFIEERITETEKELQIAEESLKDFRDRNRRIQNSPSLLLDQQRLSREVAVLTGVYTTLKQELETTKIEEVKESDYVIVLDPPEAPLYPSGPRKKRIVILTGLIGVFIGVITSFIKELLIKSKSEDRKKIKEAKILVLHNIFQLIPFKKFFNIKVN